MADAAGGVVDPVGVVVNPAAGWVADSPAGAAAGPAVGAVADPVIGEVIDSAVCAAAGPAVGADADPVIGGVEVSPFGAAAGRAVGTVAALILDARADFTSCKASDFIFFGATDPSFGIVSEDEFISVGNGNENIRTSNLKKKDKNIRRTAEII